MRTLAHLLHKSFLRIFIFVILVFPLAGSANVLNENFSTRNYFGNSTAVLNQVTNLISPPLQVASYQALCGVSTTTNLDFGDGRYGAFSSATYSNFGTYSPPYIYINTNTYPVLYVTDFTLNAGDILQPIGTNPLIIKSLSDINISGTIDCSGPAGQAANPSASTLSSGATGRCGGGNGGNGGITGTPGTSGGLGEAQSGSITAGVAATNTNGSGGGGGGGFYWVGPCAGSAGAHGASAGAGANGGAAGSNFMDAAFTLPGGGAGGGGGGPSGTWSGAGGGAGGGHIELLAFHNVNLSAGSLVTANGGNGGSSANNSGGGGGGAGGSIKIFAGNVATINGTSGVHVQNGTGGTSGTGSAGGNGGWGRVWVIDSVTSYDTGAVDTADTSLLSTGYLQYATGVFTVTSSAYDLLNYQTSFSALNSTVVNGGSGTMTLTVGGSRGGFNSDDTGFLLPAAVSSLNGSRYVRFNVSLNNTNNTTPIELSAINLNYTPGSLNNYNFKSGCGTIQSLTVPDIDDRGILGIVILLCIPLLAWLAIRFHHQVRPMHRPNI